MRNFLIKGPQIVSSSQVYVDHVLWAQDGVIRGVFLQDSPAYPRDIPCIEFNSDAWLIPGMIDLHVHGASGADVMDADPEALALMSQSLQKEGVGGYLATTMTASTPEIEKALLAVHRYLKKPVEGASILGVHLEGPYLSAKYKGAQRGELVREPNLAEFKKWQAEFGQLIKQVTLAPELPQALAFIQYLAGTQVIASIGHTDADCEQAQAAIDSGAHHATHLFNAMRGLHHRSPNAITALLLDERVSTELIVDGLHLHPDIVKLTLKIKGIDRVVLVSDAMRAKCMGEGTFDLGGQTVVVEGKAARLTNGVLAGSVLSLNHALRNLLVFTGCSMVEAVKTVSKNPAQKLGLLDRGEIAVGKRADLVVLSASYEVLQSFWVKTLLEN